MSFANLDLNGAIHKAISACGYQNPTPIQAKAIPLILAGKDIIASAATGTGKTAAFVLPALEQLTKQKPNKKTRILILTPTRELANQISKAASLYGKFLRFNIVNLVGGMPYPQQIRELNRGADIIVATPGRLLDHQENKRLNLQGVEMLILDEADRMLDMGFIDDVRAIAKLTPNTRQTLLFSATVDKKLHSITRELLREPVRVDLSEKSIAAPTIKQTLYKTANAQAKMRLLKTLLKEQQIYKAIVFSATKINADKLSGWLENEGLASAPLHGDLKQRQRNRTIEDFRRNKVQFLIATDVAARGIDIGDVTHVINYDLPRFCEDYVHRIGRTGRAGKEGIAISFVMPTDTKHLQRIERFIGKKLQVQNSSNLQGGEDNTPIENIPASKPFANKHKPYGQRQGRREDQESRPSYGRRQDQESRPSYGRRQDQESRPSYGRKQDQESRPSYGRREDQESRPGYGRRQDQESRPSYGRRQDQESRPGYGRRQDQESRPGYGRREDQESRPSYGRRQDQEQGVKQEQDQGNGRKKNFQTKPSQSFKKKRPTNKEWTPVKRNKKRTADAN